MHLSRRLLLASSLSSAALSAARVAASEPPLVFAAASLKAVLDEIATDLPMRLSYGGSGVLARQILQGAPAELYLPAHREWMDLLEVRSALQDGARVDLLGNQLVMIAPKGSWRVILHENFPTDRRIATGLVEAVPAGRYAKSALTYLGLWEAVRPNLVQTENVRVALALVARGDVPFGIVYRTDALAEPAVEIVAEFPSEAHEAIRYPLGLLSGATPQSQVVYAALQDAPAREIFSRHGFERV